MTASHAATRRSFSGAHRRASSTATLVLGIEHGDKLAFLKLNIDENPATPGKYGVISIPTINVYVNGELAKSIVGAKPKAALLKELADFTA